MDRPHGNLGSLQRGMSRAFVTPSNGRTRDVALPAAPEPGEPSHAGKPAYAAAAKQPHQHGFGLVIERMAEKNLPGSGFARGFGEQAVARVARGLLNAGPWLPAGSNGPCGARP